MSIENLEDRKDITFKAKDGRELPFTVYARPLLFDLQLNEALGAPPEDASPTSQLLHWNRIGVIFVAEGLRPGREDLPPRPELGDGTAVWWAYADAAARLFSDWGLTARAVLRLREASDALSGWSEALEAEGNG